MRKIIIYFCIVFVMFSVAACKQNGTINNVVIEVGESNKFTKEEITKAIDCVKYNFSFPACTLTKLWYDEEKSNSFTQDFCKGSVNGVQAENVIIILSNFDVDASGDNPVLNPNSTYTEYRWILIRDSKTSNWEILPYFCSNNANI